jgi:hypothetical protein
MDSQQSSGGAIFGKMVAIFQEVDAIAKTARNTSQGFNYRGIDDVYNAINPILAKHGVFMTAKILEKTREERVTRRDSGKDSVLAFTCLHMSYRFNAEDGSFVETESEGEGMDSGDKSSNKAMSVAHKYALLQAFCIPTKDLDDPDAQSHEVAPRQSQGRPPAEQPKGNPPPRTEAPKQQANNSRVAPAKAWAEEATRFVLTIKDGKALETWNTKNAKAIAAARDLAPEAHKALLAAIDKRRADLNPLSA